MSGLAARGAKIKERLSSIGKPDRHEAAAAEIAGGRIDHRERIADRNGRIDRAAAALENVDPDFRRKVLRRDDHGLFCGHGPHRGGIGSGNPNYRRQAGDQDVKPTKADFQLSPQSSQ
jgi:hypothetical protein